MKKAVIGISIGDINGIGPEIIIKTLSQKKILDYCTPVIYANASIINYYRKAISLPEFRYQVIKSIEEVRHKGAYIMECWTDNVNIQVGIADKEIAKYTKISLERLGEDLQQGHLDAGITAPINKELIQVAGFNYPGQTEFFTEISGSNSSLMLLCANTIKIGTVTGHVPINEVLNNLSKEKISAKLKILIKSLKKDFGINKPRVAVLGLNPHAGENGKIGNTEEEMIKPTIEEFKNKGELVFGPYPADGLFGSGNYRKFDAVLGMYHDQALIPFKMIAFEEGVNYTAGLSIIRTSPDHGTAFDIAGKGSASESSFRHALFTAIDISRMRNEKSPDS